MLWLFFSPDQVYSFHSQKSCCCCSVMSNSLWPRGLQHSRFPCFSLSPRVCSNVCPLIQWCHPTISFSVSPFSSCPQSFPASGSFPVSQLFEPGGQSIGASISATVLPVGSRLIFYSSWRYAPLLLATASVKRQTSCMPGPALKATHSKVRVSNSWGLSSLCSAPYSRCSL